MKNFFFVLLVSTFFVGCKKDISSSIKGPNTANNATVHEPYILRYNVGQVLGSWCTPEDIEITGFIEVRVNQLTLPDGSTHFTLHQRFENIRGVGLSSGLEYMLIGQQMDVVKFNPTKGLRQTANGKFTWKSPGAGKGTTFINTIKLRYILDENLNVVLEESFFGFECH